MKRPKNLNVTSKRIYKPRKPKVYKLADGSEFESEYHNQSFSKPVYKDKTKDPEDGPKPKDKASKHKYPPPKKDPVFRSKWMRFIDALVKRDNFKIAHLDALEILCDFYTEYEELSKVIRTSGRTYESVSRLGTTIKIRPEVLQLEKCQANIRAYTRMLDLFPKKDANTGSDGEDDDWK